jgi:hypothetical protein
LFDVLADANGVDCGYPVPWGYRDDSWLAFGYLPSSTPFTGVVRDVSNTSILFGSSNYVIKFSLTATGITSRPKGVLALERPHLPRVCYLEICIVPYPHFFYTCDGAARDEYMSIWIKVVGVHGALES